MSAGSPENQKCYVDRGVQTGSSKASDSSSALELAQENSLSLFEGLESSAIMAEELSYVSSAYMRLSPHSSPLLTATERPLKPQLPMNKPSNSNQESVRIVSLPETAPLFSGRRALKSTARIVSMPEQGSSNSYMLDNSVSSSDRVDASVLTGDSYTSLEDENSGSCLSRRRQGIPHTPSPPSSPDSVLIIEHNGELSEAFLRKKCSEADESSDSAQEPTGDDEGWISWAKSPPRPIPALHGPLSLPYARCPSGAEGTIIEGPGDLPRMIWGLESDEYALPQSQSGSEDAGPPPQKLISVSQSPAQSTPRKSHQEQPTGCVQKPQPHSTLSVSRIESRDSVDLLRESAQHGEQHVTVEARYPRGLFDDAIVLENLVQDNGTARTFRTTGNNLVSSVLSDTSVLRQIDSDYDARRQFNAARTQPQRRSANDTLRTGHAIGDIFAEPFPSSGRMRVTTRPALGSALPQILIEPRSPENVQIPPRRSSAMEIAQQYRQQIQRQHGHLLPTPPNSSSPLWSSDFSPYQDSILSPNLTSHVSGLPLSLSSNQILNSLVSSSHLRQQYLDNVNDFSYDLGLAPSLAPPAQISSSTRLQVPVTNGSNVFIPQSSTSYVSHRQHGSSPASAPLVSPRPPANTPATVERRNVYPQAHIQAPPSPTSPENFRTRGSSQNQPRSIPLARLMQRRLSAVPEEDSISPARGSPASGAVSGNTGLQRTTYRASNAASHSYVDSQITYPMSAIQLQAKARGSANAAAAAAQQGLATQSRFPDYSLGELYIVPATVDAQARVRLPSPSRSRSENGRREEASRYELARKGRQESERYEQMDKEGAVRGSMGRKKMRSRARKPFAGAANR